MNLGKGAGSLRKDVGSLFIAGLEGTTLSAAEAAWLRLVRPSGVILFRRNIEESSQLHTLLQTASAHSSQPLFRCVDLEGGLVDRLRDLVAPLPSSAAVAFTRNTKLAQQHGRLIGDEIRLLGFNTTFAPVLDLALPISANVMKTRVAAADAPAVIEYAGNFLKGLHKAGVLGSGKHFPGLGGGTLDSHTAMPEIDREWQQLWEEDLLPYRQLHRRLPFIMISHAAYSRVEGTQRPASLSHYWITDVLKKKIGYRGLILSDDMEMGGVLGRNSIEDASIAAIEAGTHVLEVCKDPALVLRAYEAVLTEAERSSSFRRRVVRAAAHVRRRKAKLLKNDSMAPVATPKQVQKMRDRIATFTAELLGSQATLQAEKKRSPQ